MILTPRENKEALAASAYSMFPNPIANAHEARGDAILIGFGVSESAETQLDLKRKALLKLDGLHRDASGRYLRSTPGHKRQIGCKGDSGGPLLNLAGDVIGVLSHLRYTGVDDEQNNYEICRGTIDNQFASTFEHRAFLQQTLQSWCLVEIRTRR